MPSSPHRRKFLKNAAALAVLGLTGGAAPRTWAAPKSAALPQPSAAKLPRWRGFNLLEKFIARQENLAFRESDFAWMAEWGFDFVRLPMSYRCWSTPENWREMKESVLKEVDQAVDYGRQYGIHVSLNFHRAPGYSVDRGEEEPFNLWTDAAALEACAYQWGQFAHRYRSIPNSALSFDLINEPAMMSWQPEVQLDGPTYIKVVRALVGAIRAESPERLVIADGLMWGRIPVPELAELKIAQSTRGYDPMPVSHWKAEWVEGSEKQPAPTWPLPVSAEDAAGARSEVTELKQRLKTNTIVQNYDGAIAATDWNRTRIQRQLIEPWKQLEDLGVGVHVGECGAYNHTPHEVALAWLRDMTSAWTSAGWGWALWNFRGPFGILDSERSDVNYENFRGHKLDRAMLELLRSS